MMVLGPHLETLSYLDVPDSSPWQSMGALRSSRLSVADYSYESPWQMITHGNWSPIGVYSILWKPWKMTANEG